MKRLLANRSVCLITSGTYKDVNKMQFEVEGEEFSQLLVNNLVLRFWE